jgi:hypothetical protein
MNRIKAEVEEWNKQQLLGPAREMAWSSQKGYELGLRRGLEMAKEVIQREYNDDLKSGFKDDIHSGWMQGLKRSLQLIGKLED